MITLKFRQTCYNRVKLNSLWLGVLLAGLRKGMVMSLTL